MSEVIIVKLRMTTIMESSKWDHDGSNYKKLFYTAYATDLLFPLSCKAEKNGIDIVDIHFLSNTTLMFTLCPPSNYSYSLTTPFVDMPSLY